MNLQNIISDIAEQDPEVFEKISDRRRVFKHMTGVGQKIALTAIPFALGSMFKKAYGQSGNIIFDTLNFALTLEYIEAEFYNRGVANLNNGTLTGATANEQATFGIIATHENNHVTFLKTAISAAGGTPASKPTTFDFTAKGAFPNSLTDYPTFLALAQAFEDTGVRAYKGQAPNLMTNRTYLTAALNIHSVEARHASKIRAIRQSKGIAVKSWITLAQSGIAGGKADPNYAGEDLLVQAGVNIVNIGGFSISANAASEAFDEPLDKNTVTALVTPFIT